MPTRLTDLADVLRGAGLSVMEIKGWQDRSRQGDTSWYVDGRPTHVMVHHTASPASAHNTVDKEHAEARFCALYHSVKPVANLYLGPSGTWYVLAAGPTNTNGVGLDTWGGGVPKDSMNSWAVSIEAGNDGVGEPYPQVMQDSYVTGCAALCKAYGIPAHHVRGHLEYAPTRKIDPAGPSLWMSPTDGSKRWNMNAFRGSVVEALNPPPLPPLNPNPSEGEEMITGLWKGPNDPGVYAVCSNGTKIWCYPGTVDEHQALLRLNGRSDAINVQTSADMFRAFGPVIGPRPAGVDEYGWK